MYLPGARPCLAERAPDGVGINRLGRLPGPSTDRIGGHEVFHGHGVRIGDIRERGTCAGQAVGCYGVAVAPDPRRGRTFSSEGRCGKGIFGQGASGLEGAPPPIEVP